jgi:hypothetical protein
MGWLREKKMIVDAPVKINKGCRCNDGDDSRTEHGG